MEEIKPTPRTTVNRMRKRGSYDRELIYSILDRSLVCHVGVVVDGTPRVLPTLHARIDDSVFIHGAASNRMIRTAAEGVEVCLTATLIDGLVMARSAFHHSVNYRSAVIFGVAHEVADPDSDPPRGTGGGEDPVGAAVIRCRPGRGHGAMNWRDRPDQTSS